MIHNLKLLDIVVIHILHLKTKEKINRMSSPKPIESQANRLPIFSAIQKSQFPYLASPFEIKAW